MIFVGLGMNLSYITANTLIQTFVDDDKRNRVMGLYVMILSGMAPIGSFVTGLVADGMGTGRTFLYGGLVCLASAFLFLQGLPRFQAATDAKSAIAVASEGAYNPRKRRTHDGSPS